MTEKMNFYDAQKALVPSNCQIISEVNYDDINENALIFKSLFKEVTENYLTQPESEQDRNDNEVGLQPIIRQYLHQFDIFKLVDNTLYFQLIAGSKSDADILYSVDMLVVDLKDSICPKCGEKYTLIISQGKDLPDGSHCTSYTIKCSKCSTQWDSLKLNVALLLTEFACCARYAKTTISAEAQTITLLTPSFKIKTKLPKKYFRC